MELKEIVEEIHKDHKTFKEEHTKMLKDKADGKSVADLAEKVEKLNKSMDAGEQRLKELQTAINRHRDANADGDKTEIEEKVLRKSFRQWLSKGDRGDLSSAIAKVFQDQPELKTAYYEKHPEIKALAVNDDTAGGFMVHADLSGRIVKRIFETSPIRQYANVQSISTDALEGVIDADEGTATWVEEQGSRPQTANPKIGMWRIPTHELYASPAATQKLLDDAAWDPEQWLSAKVADKFARTENAAFVNGNGVGKPRGFLDELKISDASGAGDPGGANDSIYIAQSKIGYTPTGAAGAFPDVPTSTAPTAQGNPLINLIYSLKTQYRNMPGTAFAMNRACYAAVRKLQDAFGQYIWQPGFNGQPATLFGYPIAEFNDMPAIAANTYSIAFANWREAYQIVDRIGIRVLRDPYTAKPFVLFYTTKRVGGKTLNYEAIKLLKFAAS